MVEFSNVCNPPSCVMNLPHDGGGDSVGRYFWKSRNLRHRICAWQ